MSMTLVGRLPYHSVLTYERVHAEDGSPMHKSAGNMIEANEAFDAIGADLMRWLYCATPSYTNVNFGFGLAGEVRRRLLTLWSSAGFLVTYANIAGWDPAWGTSPDSDHPLDRWLVARTAQLVQEAEDGYERFWTPSITTAFDAYVEDLSNWYVRRSRRRFWDGEPAALTTLWWSLQTSLRAIAPVMPFLSEHLWQTLVSEVCADAPASVHLAGWPDGLEPDAELLADQAEVRRVVELGRQARSQASINLRQPLRQMFVRGSSRAAGYTGEIADELNVKEVLVDQGPVARVQLKPNLPLLGPRLGAKLREVAAALASGDYEELDGGAIRAAGEELAPEELIRGERLSVDGFVMANDDVVSVALSTDVDDELLREKRVRDLIREINVRRKDAGLEITDRIVVTLPADDGDLVTDHGDWIKRETLAVELRVDRGALAIEKV
jgi:isoleucyl-tRNA synthetase